MKLAFVIPTYNDEAYIAEAVKSALSQTVKDVQVVVVDDGSTDDTRTILNFMQHNEPNLHVVLLNENKGRGAARNAGIEYAEADIIMVLDADDVADKNRAKATLEAFKSDPGLFHGAAEVTDTLFNQQGQYIPDAFDPVRFQKDKQTGIIHSTVAYSKELWEKYKYDEGEYSEIGLDDWHQQARMILDGVNISHTTKVLGAYRVNSSGISKTRNPKTVMVLKEKFLGSKGVANVAQA